MDVPMCPGQVSSGPCCVDLQSLGFSFSQGPRQKFDHDYRNSLQDSLWFTNWENSEGSPVKSKLVFFLLWKNKRIKWEAGSLSTWEGSCFEFGRRLSIIYCTLDKTAYIKQGLYGILSDCEPVQSGAFQTWQRGEASIFFLIIMQILHFPLTLFSLTFENQCWLFGKPLVIVNLTHSFLSRVLCWGVSQKWKH